MLLLILLLSALFGLTLWCGYRQLIRLEHLNWKRVINGFLIAMLLLTLMSVAHWLGLISRGTAARLTMGLYVAVSGFFTGFGARLFHLRGEAGNILYVHRSPWADLAPNLISIGLFAYGVYRTGLLSWGPFTGIGITSGLSLMGFAFLGWTVRIVPEFRFGGILLVDQLVEWKRVISFQWAEEEILKIDYMTEGDALSEFNTYIPAEERKTVERMLAEKLQEHNEERRRMVDRSGEGKPEA